MSILGVAADAAITMAEWISDLAVKATFASLKNEEKKQEKKSYDNYDGNVPEDVEETIKSMSEETSEEITEDEATDNNGSNDFNADEIREAAEKTEKIIAMTIDIINTGKEAPNDVSEKDKKLINGIAQFFDQPMIYEEVEPDNVSSYDPAFEAFDKDAGYILSIKNLERRKQDIHPSSTTSDSERKEESSDSTEKKGTVYKDEPVFPKFTIIDEEDSIHPVFLHDEPENLENMVYSDSDKIGNLTDDEYKKYSRIFGKITNEDFRFFKNGDGTYVICVGNYASEKQYLIDPGLYKGFNRISLMIYANEISRYIFVDVNMFPDIAQKILAGDYQPTSDDLQRILDKDFRDLRTYYNFDFSKMRSISVKDMLEFEKSLTEFAEKFIGKVIGAGYVNLLPRFTVVSYKNPKKFTLSTNANTISPIGPQFTNNGRVGEIIVSFNDGKCEVNLGGGNILHFE